MEIDFSRGNLSENDAYDACVEYMAIKMHFSGNYDYFKYRGKVNLKRDSFEKRKDKYFYYMLSRKRDFHNIILANFLENQNVYIRDINSQSGKDVYLNWKKRVDSLTYTFESDIKKLRTPMKSNFKVVEGRHPELLKMYISEEICLETLVIMMDLTKINLVWDKEIDDPVVYPRINTLVKNYLPFLQYDKNKFGKIMLDKELEKL